MEPQHERSLRPRLPAPLFLIFFGVMVFSLLAAALSSPETSLVLLRGGTPPVFATGFGLAGPLPASSLLVLSDLAMLGVLLLGGRGAVPWTRASAAILAAVGLSLFASVIVTPLSLPASALAGVLLLSIYLMVSESAFGVRRANALGSVILLVSSMLLFVEAGSAIRWVANGFDGGALFSGADWSLSYLDLQLFEAASPAMPQLVLLFFAGWFLRLLANYYLDDVKGFFRRLFPPGPGAAGAEPLSWLGRGHAIPLLFFASLVTAAFVGVYPYLPAINHGSILVGTDVAFNGYYVNNLNNMLALPPLQALSSVASSDRYLLLVLQYALAGATGSAGAAMRLMPALLGVLAAASTFLVTYAGSRDRLLASVAALFAGTGIVEAVGVNGAFYANWLGLSLTFAFVALLLTGLEGRPSRIVLACLVSILLQYCHLWSWFFAMAVTVGYLPVSFLAGRPGQRRAFRGEAQTVALVVGVSVLAYAARALLTGGGGTTEAATTLARFDVAGILQVYGNLAVNFQNFLGGALVDPPLIILAAIGLFSIPTFGGRFQRFLLSWTVVAALAVLFTDFSNFIQARILYVVPFQIFEAMGVLAVLRLTSNFFRDQSGGPTTRTKALQLVLLVVVYSVSLSYALRTVGVLYTGS